MDMERAAKNIWTVSDQQQKQALMRRFIELHGESTSHDEFFSFLADEFGIDYSEEIPEDAAVQEDHIGG